MEIGQLRSHDTNRRRVSDNNNISQLLRDSYSVSQQPPIWEPPSHYSMGCSCVTLSFVISSTVTALSDCLTPASQFNISQPAIAAASECEYKELRPRQTSVPGLAGARWWGQEETGASIPDGAGSGYAVYTLTLPPRLSHSLGAFLETLLPLAVFCILTFLLVLVRRKRSASKHFSVLCSAEV